MSQSYHGWMLPQDMQDEHSATGFMIDSRLAKMQTATIVQVVAVSNNGEVAPVGTVDVQPMVHQVDGANAVEPHGVIHKLPYLRHGGGSDAVIADPKVGDIGIMVFCSRDTSTVKTTRAPGVPSLVGQRHDWADGYYVGQTLNLSPTQYLRYSESGIELVSPVAVTISAPQVTINATTNVSINAPSIDLNKTS